MNNRYTMGPVNNKCGEIDVRIFYISIFYRLYEKEKMTVLWTFTDNGQREADKKNL